MNEESKKFDEQNVWLESDGEVQTVGTRTESGLRQCSQRFGKETLLDTQFWAVQGGIAVGCLRLNGTIWPCEMREREREGRCKRERIRCPSKCEVRRTEWSTDLDRVSPSTDFTSRVSVACSTRKAEFEGAILASLTVRVV